MLLTIAKKSADSMMSLTFPVCRVAVITTVPIDRFCSSPRCRLTLVYYTNIGYLSGKLHYGYWSAVNIDGSHFACLFVAIVRSILSDWKMWKNVKNVKKEIEKCRFLYKGKKQKNVYAAFLGMLLFDIKNLHAYTRMFDEKREFKK